MIRTKIADQFINNKLSNYDNDQSFLIKKSNINYTKDFTKIQKI